MGTINYYIYKWNEYSRRPVEQLLRPGDRVSVSIRDFSDPENRAAFAALRANGAECYCVLPVLWRPGQGPDPEEVLPDIDGFYAGNPGQIKRLLDMGKPVMGDAGLNVFNRETAEAFAGIGLSGVTWSYELEEMPLRSERERPRGKSQADFRQREDQEEDSLLFASGSQLPASFSNEILRSGRVPAMVSEYCPLAGAEGIRGSGCGRCREENPVWLKDFKGERYPVLLEPRGCTALILSRRPLDRPWADELASDRNDVIRRICIFE